MRKWLPPLLVSVALSCFSQRANAQASAAPAAVSPSVPSAPTQRSVVYDKNATLRVALLATGIPLFALSYGLPCVGERGVWCAPVVGPIVKIKHIADKEAQTDPEQDGIVPPVFVYTLLVELAAVQLASASLIMAGALLPRREGRRVVQTVNLVPSLTPTTVGLTALGTF
ncbi:MAG TPA: hypothetical protein VHP33_13190 [Polyangiaceae bacterium]|nr:hypothetical protein [Polyangiaceae bacterium]